MKCKDNSKFCINIKMYKTICVIKRIKRDKTGIIDANKVNILEERIGLYLQLPGI